MMVRGGIDGHGITYCFASHWRFGGVWGGKGWTCAYGIHIFYLDIALLALLV